MATKADLRRLVLAHLTVIDPEDTPTAGQASQLDLWIDADRAWLLERGLCWWDEDDIPAAVSGPLARFVAAGCCAAFGKANKGYEAQRNPARKEIAALKSSEQRETVRQDYF